MEEISSTLIWGLVVFIIVFLVNYFLILKRPYKNGNKKKKKKNSLKDFIGLSYVIPRFDLDEKKIEVNYAFILISLVNALIISLTSVIVYIIPWALAFKMLLGFVLLFGFIYAMYELLGRWFVKKGWNK